MISFANPKHSLGRFTLEEAAVLAGVPEKLIRRTLESKLKRAARRHGRRRFGARDVLAFRALASLPFRADPETTLHLLRLLTGLTDVSGDWRRVRGALVHEGEVRVEIDLAVMEADVVSIVRAYRDAARTVVVDPEVLGGEPVFAGTRVSVSNVGALVRRGVPLATLREDFPRLTEDQLRFAGWFVALGRPPGRPRRKLKLVRTRR